MLIIFFVLTKMLSVSSHLLLILLVLELFTLSLLALLTFTPYISHGGALLLVTILTLAVGEARLGLSLLVLSARNLGNDALGLLQ